MARSVVQGAPAGPRCSVRYGRTGGLVQLGELVDETATEYVLRVRTEEKRFPKDSSKLTVFDDEFLARAAGARCKEGLRS